MSIPLLSPPPPTRPNAERDRSPSGWPTRRRSKGRKVLALFAAAAAGIAGVALATGTGRGPSSILRLGPAPAFGPSARVARARLRMAVVERGDLESARNIDVASEVEGQATILYLKPEGAHVKKGELVCELDGAALREKRNSQVLVARQAESDLRHSIKTRELAEFAVLEYVEGTYVQQIMAARADLALAEVNLAQAVDSYAWSSLMVRKGCLPPSQAIAADQSLVNCEINRNKADTRIRVLENYTRKKTLIELRAQVDKARSDELAKTAIRRLEAAKLAKLEAQVAKCRIVAPADGLIVYANNRNSRRGGNRTLIEEGASVRQRQSILQLPDTSRLRVNLRIHESLVDRIAPGQRARVWMDSSAGEPLSATVESIRPLPARAESENPDLRVYTTLVSIDDPRPGLRPGMSAQVEILMRQLDDTLAVPVEAVLPFKGKYHVFVATPDGPELRAVELGAADDERIEVRGGVREGEEVSLRPISLMSERERREAFIAWIPDASEDG